VRLLLQVEEEDHPVSAEVLAILLHQGKRLYAVTASVTGAAWYGLIHEDSTALLSSRE
jgi:hypothetical protein